MLSGGHIIYIPLVLLAGVVLGFMLGRHSAQREKSEAADRLAKREARVSELKQKLSTDQTSGADDG